MPRFWNFINNEATETNPESIELRISGDIVSDDDSWIYEWLGIAVASPNAFRNELSQYDGKDIKVWVDSCGGDVFAGAGIYNALKSHNGKVTIQIDGKAMSAASVIAMAGDEILMSPVGVMMIHNPLSAVQGYASDMRKQADVLDTVKESIMNAYCTKTKKSRNQVSAMMDGETWMDANTAVKEGFADGVLYDESEEPKNIMNFAFNRLSIQNSANNSFKHMLELKDKIKVNNMNQSDNCICCNCNHSDNCQSTGAKCCICSNCSMVEQCSKPGTEGCQCNICSMPESNCCQPDSESCMCDVCENNDCMKGNMDNSQTTMNSKNNINLLKEKLALKCKL